MALSLSPSRALFAAAMIGLGITGLVNGDFALVWQRIPLHHPLHPPRVWTGIAYVCAVIEVATGIGLLLKPGLMLACRVLFPYLALWLVLLEIPVVAHLPLNVGAWGSVGEIAIMTAGCWCLFASQAGTWEQQHLKFAVGPQGIRLARLLLILSLPMIGLEVIIARPTSLPPWVAWLPSSPDWVYLSGAGSLATGLALLLGVWPRLAATLEAAMLGIITVYFWGPYLHTGRTATTAFLISALIAAGVWLVADTYHGLPWFAIGRKALLTTTDYSISAEIDAPTSLDSPS